VKVFVRAKICSEPCKRGLSSQDFFARIASSATEQLHVIQPVLTTLYSLNAATTQLYFPVAAKLRIFVNIN